jgi:capsular exopolysaccharide synthesis family protein
MTPSLTTPAPPSRAADAPDWVQLLRRHSGLLAAGLVLGAAAAAAIFAYRRTYEPRYRAAVQFQVLPPPAPLTVDVAPPVVLNPDDTSQFIHRQVRYLTQGRVLDLILHSREFQTDHRRPDDPAARSGWLAANAAAPLAALRRDLAVTPLIDSAAFEISMTARDPYEACSLVTAVGQVYVQTLRADNRQVTADRLAALTRIRKDQETTVQNLNAALAQFTAAQNVPALAARYKIELETLQQLTAELVRAEALESAARLAADNARALAAAPAPALTPDLEQWIKDDAQFRTLENTRLSLEQDRSGMVAAGTTPRLLAGIDARLAKAAEQLDAARKDLAARAVARVAADARARLEALSAQAGHLRQAHRAKQDEVKLLDASLVQHQQKVDELKAQEDILDKLRRQETLATLGSSTDDTRIQQIVSAVEPTDPVSPALAVYLPTGAAAGLAVALALAYLLTAADTRVRTPRDVTAALHLPLLGFVPDAADDRTLAGDVAAALVTAPASVVAESFRQIRAHVAAQTDAAPARTLLVASVTPGGGATAVAANLAAAFALSDHRVLLVDASVRRPGLGRVYDHMPAVGLADVLADPALLPAALLPHPRQPRLHLLGAGRHAAGPTELIGGRAFRLLLETLESRYDLILFDGPPFTLLADAHTLAARVDAVIPVIRAGHVTRGAVARVREQLRHADARVLGFVLNAARVTRTGYFKEHYRSFYRYAAPDARHDAKVQKR